jgi:hypothetical protein
MGCADMAEAKPIASLSPTLLARKGGARPAIRSAQPELTQTEDAGEASRESATRRGRNQAGAKVVTLNTVRIAAPAGKGNVLRRQRERLSEQFANGAKPRQIASAASAKERPAAFTLRLDADRHLRLRLASALAGRSAQQLVVEALDSMLASLPELTAKAARAGKQRQIPQKGDTP